MSQFIEPEIHIGCIGPGNPMTIYFYLFEVHKMFTLCTGLTFQSESDSI